ncbi:unnamed protein product [Fraxinus pennsylvanica]|uniref:Uncharacterized protein n=1 Tax=Fraxinus pennsylvanica TaxID=56036 RepID=A0AAD1ZXC9_9LAMI|nr:unnamed protein product [Fraxinus pennsylvanica]
MPVRKAESFEAKGMNARFNNCKFLEELSVKRLSGVNDGVRAEPKASTSLVLRGVWGNIFGGLKVKNVVSGEVTNLNVSGLFFAIGHEPATKFLDGQLEVDSDGYVISKPGIGLVG